jgi:hypothetical protein
MEPAVSPPLVVGKKADRHKHPSGLFSEVVLKSSLLPLSQVLNTFGMLSCEKPVAKTPLWENFRDFEPTRPNMD